MKGLYFSKSAISSALNSATCARNINLRSHIKGTWKELETPRQTECKSKRRRTRSNRTFYITRTGSCITSVQIVYGVYEASQCNYVDNYNYNRSWAYKTIQFFYLISFTKQNPQPMLICMNKCRWKSHFKVKENCGLTYRDFNYTLTSRRSHTEGQRVNEFRVIYFSSGVTYPVAFISAKMLLPLSEPSAR